MYQEEAGRRHEQAKYETIEQYLASLSLSITVHPARPDEVLRIAQLTQKTNQFNLTTRRYSEAQIAAFVVDPDWGVISLSVRDKFGDSGLTGVLLARKDSDCGTIDTLLMSCRILGRTIEVAFVGKALELMEQTWGIASWKAAYIPSPKNQQVADFWRLMGFTETGCRDGQTLYELTGGAPRREAISYIVIEKE
jgi:FkbH-like protein